MKRIHHTYDKWECYPAGFYDSVPRNNVKKEDCQKIYADFLRNLPEFEAALERVITEWPNSCEHYLTNENMNRIAWLGQSSLCIAKGVPSCFRGGFNMLSETDQRAADAMALKYLNRWLASRGETELTLDGAASKSKADLY